MVVVEEVPTDGEGPTFMNVYPTKSGARQRRNVRRTEKAADEDEDSFEDDGEDNPESELSFDEQVRKERERFQATPMEKFMALAKSLILRALVIYFIMTFIRGSSSTSKTTKSTDGAGNSTSSDDAGMFKYISDVFTQLCTHISDDIQSIRKYIKI